MAAGGARPAVFLDRDGTLHRELADAPRSPGEIELLQGVDDALASLASLGFALVVVTNQSAVARGATTLDEVRAIHAELARRVSSAGAPIAAFYVCPHHPTEGEAPYRRPCACRKPAPGLIVRATRELDLDPARSWIVGDARRDLEAGWTLGIRPILVRTGKGEREAAELAGSGLGRAALVVADLPAAAAAIREVERPGA